MNEVGEQLLPTMFVTKNSVALVSFQIISLTIDSGSLAQVQWFHMLSQGLPECNKVEIHRLWSTILTNYCGYK